MDKKKLISFYRKHPVIATEDLLHQELAPFQKIMLSLAWFNKFCFWIACRGAGKSHMLSIFSVLKGILYPDSPVILTAGVFRQAKHTFTDEVEAIIDGSVICKRAVKKISHWNDQYTVVFKNKSKIIAIPLGKGTKEGEGAAGFHGSLVIDEFWRIPKETFDSILFPFLGVSRNPIERMRLLQQKRSTFAVDNSLLIASTAYYQFNHLYKRWAEHLKKIKASKDCKIFIRDKAIAGGGKAAVNFTWKDLPKGFLDEEVIKDAQDEPESFAMMYNNEFKSDTVGPYKRSLLENLRYIKPYDVLLQGRPGKEYVVGCLLPDTKILTDKGFKKIQDVNSGDKVLSHTNRFSRVIMPTVRKYTGDIITIKGWSLPEIKFTPEHPVYVERNGEKQFVRADELTCSDILLYPKFAIENDYLKSKISYIKTEQYNGNVYNLATEDHSYCTDAYCVHNCDIASLQDKFAIVVIEIG